MTDLTQVFAYAEHRIRTVLLDAVVYFVIADLCRALELTNPTMVAERLHPDDLSRAEVIDAMGRRQEARVVNEPGMYQLVFMSEKPEARRFARWVFENVLPEIRRTGAYGHAATLLPPEQPATYTLSDAAAIFRQYFGVPVRSVFDLTSLLRDAGIFRQTPAPCTEYQHWFWNTGSAWTVRRTALSEIAYRLMKAFRDLNGAAAALAPGAPSPVQLVLDLDRSGDPR